MKIKVMLTVRKTILLLRDQIVDVDLGSNFIFGVEKICITDEVLLIIGVAREWF
jgi:hypothetical protein